MSNKRIRWFPKSILVVIIFLVTGCGAASASPTPETPIPGAFPTIRLFTRTPVVFPTRSPTPNDGISRIQIGDNYFEPSDVTIRRGMVVEWWNSGNGIHTITSLQGAWPLIYPAFGNRYRISINTHGVFAYVCSFHSGMNGTIRVVD